MQTETAQSPAPVDRSTNPAEFQSRYGGQYVALHGDRVVASAARLDEVLKRVAEFGQGREHLIIAYVDPPDVIRAY
jgi:Family of unknown function (DUF5678)